MKKKTTKKRTEKSESKKSEAKKEKAKKPKNSKWLIIGGAALIVIIIIGIILLVGGKEKTPTPPNNNTIPGQEGLSFTQAIAQGVQTGSGKGGAEDDDPAIGSPDAPVTIIEYSDFQCPYCGGAEGTNEQVVAYLKKRDSTWTPAVPSIIKDYVTTGKVRFIFRDFAISGHQYAQKAAEASECADEQGKYWEYHDVLFEHQDALTAENLKQYAETMGLDTVQFNECLDSGRFSDEVKNDFDAGVAAGVSGTPAFFINGELVEGAYPYSHFKKIIDAKLSE